MNDAVIKNQHFLPCAYLKFFSIDGTWKKGRKTPIWFTDGTKSRIDRVQNLGVQKYTYTKTDPEFEKTFQIAEGKYPVLIERILNGQIGFSGTDFFLLLRIIFDFHIRGIAYENRSDMELTDIYNRMSQTLVEEFFKEVGGQRADPKDRDAHLVKNWGIHIVSPESQEKFISSDNPSTIYCSPTHGRPVMVYLPIHPRFALIPYDNREIRLVSEKATDDVLSLLNGLQVARNVRHTYADHDLSEDLDTWEKIRSLAEGDKPERWSTADEWKPDFISIEEDLFDRFTFVRKKRAAKSILSNAVKRALH